MPAGIFGDLGAEERRPCRVLIGRLELWFERLPLEWRLGWRQSASAHPPVLDRSPGPWPAELEPARYADPRGTEAITLFPVLSQRRTVFHPSPKLSVLPGHGVGLWVQSPLYLAISAAGEELARVPIARLKETWFGPSTVDGELCLRASADAISAEEPAPRSYDHALTKLRIDNDSTTPLLVERVVLPAPNLSLWLDEQGAVHTPSVSIRRSKDALTARLTVADAPPKEVIGPRPTGGPRPRSPSVIESDLDRLLK